MMLHSTVMIVVLLNILIALLNESVTSGLAKAKTRALVSFASCILRLENTMNLSDADTLKLMQVPGPKGHRVLNPMFMEPVSKDTLKISPEQVEVLLVDAADRQLWANLFETIDDVIEREFGYLVAALHAVSHYTTINVEKAFADELRLVETARTRLHIVVEYARKRRSRYKEMVLIKVQARVTKTMANLSEQLLTKWKLKWPHSRVEDNSACYGWNSHSKCVILLRLTQRSGLQRLMQKVTEGVTSAVENISSTQNDVNTDAAVKHGAMSKLQIDVSTVKELVAAQSKSISDQEKKSSELAGEIAMIKEDMATIKRDMSTMNDKLDAIVAMLTQGRG
ncbi:hypothetical protein ACHHYP_05771 [Achlya hypogyna]|uniref:Secreted protein n=1 Tax=Achlya hypogyna TaxID=1202772 RepID=A0A1V9YWR7_ACHHY|nr:hypothetical protein ACHHYP_05771 [Achlya hypogyna]